MLLLCPAGRLWSQSVRYTATMIIRLGRLTPGYFRLLQVCGHFTYSIFLKSSVHLLYCYGTARLYQLDDYSANLDGRTVDRNIFI